MHSAVHGGRCFLRKSLPLPGEVAERSEGRRGFTTLRVDYRIRQIYLRKFVNNIEKNPIDKIV